VRLDWLKVFLTLGEELHFARTASRLGMSQPAVSRAIASLESAVGVVLVDRTSRQVALTPAGEVFRRGARQTAEALERAIRTARVGEESALTDLRLGMMIGAAQPPVGNLVAEVRRREPAALLTLVTVDERDLADALSQGVVHAAVAWEASVPAGLYTRLVASVPLRVLLPEGHPLARREVVTWADLAHQPVILPARDRQPVLFDHYRAITRDHGYVPRIAMDVATTTDLLVMVASGAGIGHAPVPPELEWKGVVVRPHEPPIVTRYVLAFSTRSPAVRVLLDALEATR